MPSSCSVPDCELKYAHSEDVSYHKFPLKKPELLSEWVKFTGRDPAWVPSRWSAICSRHFKPSDFKDCIYRKNLTINAVPSVRVRHHTPISEFIAGKCDVDEEPKTPHEETLHETHSDQPDAETDQDDYSGGEETNLLDITCRLCGIVFSKWCQGLLVDFRPHSVVIGKCLPFVNLELVHFPAKVCGHCLKVINGFSAFYDSVQRAQVDLELKYNNRVDEHDPVDEHIFEAPKIRIKQEPMVNIKEEAIESNIRIRENPLPETPENTLIIKNPNVASDNNKILVFKNQSTENQNTKPMPKNCEILEIVNLYPPIVDITSATIREVQPYEITLPSISNAPSFQSAPPQIINLKTENTAEFEEEYEDYSGYYDFQLALNTLDEHSYSKLPIQADDNKDEIFPHLPEPMDPIQLGESGTVQVIHVELPAVTFSCKSCHHIFPTRLKLLRHRTFYCPSRKRPHFRCVYCAKKFPIRTQLQIHLAACHRRTARRKHLASKASAVKNAVRQVSTNQHEPQAMTHPKTYTCDMCDRTYSRMSNLRRHQLSHRPMEQWNHKCGVCQKIFDKLFDLKKHFQLSKCAGSSGGDGGYVLPVRSGEEAGTVPAPEGALDRLLYVCSTCNKQFKSYNSLKVHESIHTGLKAYICETCGKRFGGQMNLTQHRLTHTELRQFACKLCPKVFKRSGGLSQHVKSFHMKIKPYQCPVCFRDLALKADMTRCRHSKLKENG
ncbi:zinc finger protein 358 [Culex quinquefasciatus]|uniref:Zinc finger protein 358 n=1 Tax=Culex quinquefasciatus TaxID=7176 RepID=B0XEZ6_CULQU|nr:zinc finger protein 358 [Culex quinquefasciatus]|eukprot:XP_001868218.1 zinc finger protein 358 [Culex quinquefasciatus]